MTDSESIKTSCTVAHEHCKCFDYLTDEQRDLIEKNRVTVEFKKGEIIAKQGSFTSYVLMVCEGLAKVFYEDKDESLILRIAAPGSLIGLTSLTKKSNVFHYSASAYVNTTVKLIDINVFKQLIAANGLFATAIIDILSANSIQKNERFFCLTHRQAYGKLADLLMCLAGNIFRNQKFLLPLTRKDLAELAGMSTESVIRTMKKFQDDKLIVSTGKTIEIINPDGLLRICELG